MGSQEKGAGMIVAESILTRGEGRPFRGRVARARVRIDRVWRGDPTPPEPPPPPGTHSVTKHTCEGDSKAAKQRWMKGLGGISVRARSSFLRRARSRGRFRSRLESTCPGAPSGGDGGLVGGARRPCRGAQKGAKESPPPPTRTLPYARATPPPASQVTPGRAQARGGGALYTFMATKSCRCVCRARSTLLYPPDPRPLSTE